MKHTFISLSTWCVCFVPRPEIVACTWDVNWPTLGLSNATPWKGSYKGSFRVCHEACCKAWSVKMEFAPLFLREIFLWAPRVIGSRNAWPCYIRLIVNLVWDSDSQDRERVVSCRLDLISWGKGNGINIVMVRPIRSLCAFGSWHVLLEATTSYWSSRCTRVMTKRAWTYRVTHLRLCRHNSDWIRVGLE